MVAKRAFKADVEDDVVSDVGVLRSAEGQCRFFERSVKGWEEVGGFL